MRNGCRKAYWRQLTANFPCKDGILSKYQVCLQNSQIRIAILRILFNDDLKIMQPGLLHTFNANDVDKSNASNEIL